MTTILIDAGNSRLKWAVLSADGQRAVQQAVAYPHLDAIYPQIRQVLDAHRVTQVVMVHVLGDAFEQTMQTLCAEAGCAYHSVKTAATAYGITLAYDQPRQLGADRLVAMLGAQAFWQQHDQQHDTVVIDCGTAITLDALRTNGQHLGGVILPGMRSGGEALIARAKASHLAMSFDEPTLFARNTAQGIGSGSLLGTACALDGLCQRMEDELGAPLLRVLTGGDAVYLQDALQGEYQHVPELLMDGLQWVAMQAMSMQDGGDG